MKIPFVDLKTQYRAIQGEVDEAIHQVLENTAFIVGPFVKSFEENFARAHKAKYCVGVNSGTSALHLVMWAAGIRQGDEVIVPTNTFFATPEAVSLCGATPVFVDCESDYFNIDPQQVKLAITPKTKAIIAVHLYGQPAKLDELKALADQQNLLLIEDCAQAHLAEYQGMPVGTTGLGGCFSFYPGKNLGAYGEAGAVITHDDELYTKMLALRDHGSSKKYYHDSLGHNYRMEGFQGAILDVKLKYLHTWTEKKRQLVSVYRRHLEHVKEVVCPLEMPGVKHVYHLYVIRVPKRDELKKYLESKGIDTGIHYPVPCHLQKAYHFLSYANGSFPLAERYAQEILSLPIYAELTEENIQFICERIKEFYQ